MINTFKTAVTNAVAPLFQRPPAAQLAALCHRETGEGQEILLVTSSHGRWILPKGWPIEGLSSGETALREAWEEGGVKTGKVDKAPVGSFRSVKRFDSGQEVPCETTVYAVRVKNMAEDYPEAEQRERRWVAPEVAANLVDDPGLKTLLSKFCA